MNRRTFTRCVFPVAMFFGLGSFLGACATTQATTQVASKRSDCPGKMICPQTGALICKDQCPLDQQFDHQDSTEQVVALRACCQ